MTYATLSGIVAPDPVHLLLPSMLLEVASLEVAFL